MACMFLTCPETAHLELVELERHPLGLLIESCSRFEPADRVDCPRTCAARLDRRAQLLGDDDTRVDVRTTRLLVVRSLLRA